MAGTISYPPGWSARHLWNRADFYPSPLDLIKFAVLFAAIFLAAPSIERGWQAVRSRAAFGKLEEHCGLILASIAALAILLRTIVYAWGGIARATMMQDSAGYIQLAEGLLSGCGFARRIGTVCAAPDVIRTPGYPLFLAAMPSLSTAIAVQVLLAGFMCFLIGRFLRLRFGPAAGITAALLICLDLPSIQADASVWTEGLFQPLIAVWVLASLRALSRRADGGATGDALLAGFVLSLAIMVRPVGQVLVVFAPFPFLALSSHSWSRRAALALIAAAIPALSIIGWSQRNFECCGMRTVSAIAPVNLYYYHAAGVLAHRTGRDFREVMGEFEIEQQCSLVRMIDGDPSAPSPMNPAIAAEMTRRAKTIILGAPATFVAGMLIRFLYLALWAAGTTTSLQGSESGSHALQALVIYQLLWSAFVWCGIIRAVALLKRQSLRDSLMILFPLLIALLLLGVSANPAATVRFRTPAVPLFAMVGAIGWFGIPRKAQAA
ncbi:MAG: hypothetical protein ACLPQ0_18625 [Candidatus Binatus sp.]